jgi:hypothetical protein
MAVIQTLYPQSNADTVALTCTIAGLASTAAGILLAGRESTAVDNRTNRDLDHLIGGQITTGTSPTAGRVIEVWAYAANRIISGTPTYPDVLTGSDAAATMTSLNVKNVAVRLVQSIQTDNTSDRPYPIPVASIAVLFGDLPPFWGVFLTHDTGVNLNATGSNHYLHYHRIQREVA